MFDIILKLSLQKGSSIHLQGTNNKASIAATFATLITVVMVVLMSNKFGSKSSEYLTISIFPSQDASNNHFLKSVYEL